MQAGPEIDTVTDKIDMLDMNGALEMRADKIWPELAEQAGLEPASYAPTRIWTKAEPARAQIVRRYEADGQDGVIFKFVMLPDDPKRFKTTLSAQMNAAEALAGHHTCGVPNILAADLEMQALIMEEVRGKTPLQLLRDGRDPRNILRRAGQWMAAFHRASFAEKRQFQPRFMSNHIGHLLKQAQSGQIAVADFSLFESYAKAVVAHAALYEKRTTKSARTHGDMNLHNLLLDGGRGWGVDFAADRNAPVGYDIARFLLHFVGTCLDPEDYVRGHVVPPYLMEAFFKGYDFVAPDDPSVQYLLKVRLMMDWVALPERAYSRSRAKEARLRNLQTLAHGVLK